ncbi:hypothetical protein ACNJ7E_43655 [Rhodococcus sp. NM-2]|uniref:hypothetical protein n=1 Tax=Rhodococcus sp. NM-2 TaxID=3401174 RepID=UPI003AAF343B
MAADTRLDELARRIEGVPDSLPVKSLYRAFFIVRVEQLSTCYCRPDSQRLSNALDEFDGRLASAAGSLRL